MSKNTALLRLIIYNFMPVYAMKAYQGVGVLLYALSTLTLGGRERSASQDCFTLGKEPLGAQGRVAWARNPIYLYI
jgi:hypothetical protein